MAALPSHTIGSAQNGYGRFRAAAAWNSVVQEGRRVVLFPTYIMDEKNDASVAKERRLYVIDFSSVAIWATEDQDLAELVYQLLEGNCPEVCETWTLEDIGEDEECHPYEVLNNQDGSFRDVPEAKMEEISDWQSTRNHVSSKKILYVLVEDDAQDLAERKFGRTLTEQQLYQVKKSLEWGFGESWTQIMEQAVRDAVDHE